MIFIDLSPFEPVSPFSRRRGQRLGATQHHPPRRTHGSSTPWRIDSTRIPIKHAGSGIYPIPALQPEDRFVEEEPS
jgi:hypothetical protein